MNLAQPSKSSTTLSSRMTAEISFPPSCYPLLGSLLVRAVPNRAGQPSSAASSQSTGPTGELNHLAAVTCVYNMLYACIKHRSEHCKNKCVCVCVFTIRKKSIPWQHFGEISVAETTSSPQQWSDNEMLRMVTSRVIKSIVLWDKSRAVPAFIHENYRKIKIPQ